MRDIQGKLKKVMQEYNSDLNSEIEFLFNQKHEDTSEQQNSQLQV